jgi:tetratricopeptide (TPR) repeat protein
LAKDPGETVSLHEPALQERMERALNEFLKGSEKPDGSLNLERIQKLEALGYISGGSRSERVVDAKDRIGEWNDRMRAHALMRERRLPEALALIRRLRETGSQSLDLEVLEARVKLAAGNLAEARRLLAIDSDDPRVLSALAELEAADGNLAGAGAIQLELFERTGSFLVGGRYARLLAQQGRVQEAIAFVDRESHKPKEAAARAELYLELGAFPRAERIYSELVSVDPGDLSAQNGLARAMARGGDVLGALARLEGLRGTFAEDPQYLLQLGLLYNRAGQKDREVETFRALSEIAPDDPRAHFYLGKALLDVGAPPELVAKVVQAGLRLSPPPEWEIFGRNLLESLP